MGTTWCPSGERSSLAGTSQHLPNAPEANGHPRLQVLVGFSSTSPAMAPSCTALPTLPAQPSSSVPPLCLCHSRGCSGAAPAQPWWGQPWALPSPLPAATSSTPRRQGRGSCRPSQEDGVGRGSAASPVMFPGEDRHHQPSPGLGWQFTGPPPRRRVRVQTTCTSLVPAGAFRDSFGVGTALVLQLAVTHLRQRCGGWRGPRGTPGRGRLRRCHCARDAWQRPVSPGLRSAHPRPRPASPFSLPPLAQAGCPAPAALCPGGALPGRCWVSVEHATPLGCITVRMHAAHARIVLTDSVLASSNFWYLNFVIKMVFFPFNTFL